MYRVKKVQCVQDQASVIFTNVQKRERAIEGERERKKEQDRGCQNERETEKEGGEKKVGPALNLPLPREDES